MEAPTEPSEHTESRYPPNHIVTVAKQLNGEDCRMRCLRCAYRCAPLRVHSFKLAGKVPWKPVWATEAWKHSLDKSSCATRSVGTAQAGTGVAFRLSSGKFGCHRRKARPNRPGGRFAVTSTTAGPQINCVPLRVLDCF